MRYDRKVEAARSESRRLLRLEETGEKKKREMLHDENATHSLRVRALSEKFKRPALFERIDVSAADSHTQCVKGGDEWR